MSTLKMVLHAEETENQHPEKFIKISKICKESICGAVWLRPNHFFAVYSKFTYVLKLLILNNFIFPGLFYSLPGSPESNSEVLTITLLLHVQCGYSKTVYTQYQVYGV